MRFHHRSRGTKRGRSRSTTDGTRVPATITSSVDMLRLGWGPSSPILHVWELAWQARLQHAGAKVRLDLGLHFKPLYEAATLVLRVAGSDGEEKASRCRSCWERSITRGFALALRANEISSLDAVTLSFRFNIVVHSYSLRLPSNSSNHGMLSQVECEGRAL